MSRKRTDRHLLCSIKLFFSPMTLTPYRRRCARLSHPPSIAEGNAAEAMCGLDTRFLTIILGRSVRVVAATEADGVGRAGWKAGGARGSSQAIAGKGFW
jgi:hypothetical protein